MEQQAATLIETLNSELDALRQDAARYRELRNHWVDFNNGSNVVYRAAGLDEWCDKQLGKGATK